MAFLTISNSTRIIRQHDFKTTGDLKGDLYKKPIDCFSAIEKNQLLCTRNLYEDAERFFGEYYRPIITEDKFLYVFEGNKPAFHLFKDCDRLLSRYSNFKIPQEIRDK